MEDLLKELDRVEKALATSFAAIRALARSDMFAQLSHDEQCLLFYAKLKRAFQDLENDQEGK